MTNRLTNRLTNLFWGGLLLLAVVGTAVPAQEKPAAPAGASRSGLPAAPAGASRSGLPAAKTEFEKFQLVLLRRGPGWSPQATPDSARIQKEHLAHMTRMAEDGKLVVAGPFGDQQDQTLRGMCLYRVGSIEEARALAEADPAVKAGRLKVETVTWYVEKGYMAFPKAPPAKSP